MDLMQPSFLDPHLLEHINLINQKHRLHLYKPHYHQVIRRIRNLILLLQAETIHNLYLLKHSDVKLQTIFKRMLNNQCQKTISRQILVFPLIKKV